MKAVNPATNEVIKEYREHSEEDVKQIIAKVDDAFRRWKETEFSHRAELMRRAADILNNNREKYGRLISTEMGKPITEATAEVEKCAWVCTYYADNAASFLEDEKIDTDASTSFVAFQPLGVVLAVMPWNFPFWQVFRFVAPGLMAGNGAVLKHASNVPGSALAIEEVLRSAGFPEHLFRTLLIPSGKVDAIIHNEHVRAVTLTGSEPAGSAVAATAGKLIKKSVLELGGSDPFIVLEDADIPACVQTSVKSRLINTGQSCIAAKRFIVVRSIAEEFQEQHMAAMKKLKLGDPLDEDTDIGPLAREDLVDDIEKQVSASVAMGAEVLMGGERADRPGAYYLPTILTKVGRGMPAYDEETFGPVSAIIEVEDAQEAINVANDSRFGLGGAVWSRDVDKAVSVARQVTTGGMFINGHTKSDPRLPFGGVKKSGYGRELSHYGIKEFVNKKTIWIA